MFKKPAIFGIFFVFHGVLLQGQKEKIPADILSFLNQYRSPSNPHYWKNRKPYEGYWQQDVAYYIQARIDEKTDVVSGKLHLMYHNNSPDPLDFVYFNLYQNAFQPGSYLHDLTLNNGVRPRYGRYESRKLGTTVDVIQCEGQDLRTEMDGTILKAWLPRRLEPGENAYFYLEFKTYFDNGGTQRRRMKLFDAFGYKHYDGVHWYPRMAVYDRKFGWCTDQHLGHEFYGDFGAYYAELDFNSQFVVEATGDNINREEVLPRALREKLDLRNFARKPWNSPPTEIIPYDSASRKVWKFAALNVHDFAWTADPTYRIGEVYDGPWKTVALVQEPHAAGWQNAASFAMQVIKTYSRDFGPYIYPKMVVADARDGMEYPMLTLDGGYDPNYRDLLAHEIGHNWFFGMVGNNETYRAALDEGFTQFLTSWALEKIDGPYYVQGPYKSAYLRRFIPKVKVREGEVFDGYMADAIHQTEVPINTHSDKFNGALGHGGGYRQVYYKTATMLYNLQYVLGDEVFLKALQYYFNRWYLCHPYEEDFVAAVRDFTKADIVWFWDQWFTTTKTIDYAITRVRKTKEKDVYAITFRRKGRMEMPLEFTVTARDGSERSYLIPNTWYEKPIPANMERLPRWIGWDNIRKTYTATLRVPGGIKALRIDTSARLADVYRLDNARPMPQSVQFDHGLPLPPDYKSYQTYIRPDLWYTGLEGLRLGVRMRGDYYQKFHMWELGVWAPTFLLRQVNRPFYANPKPEAIHGFFKYETALDTWWRGISVQAEVRWLDGLRMGQAGFSRLNDNRKWRVFAFVKAMYRDRNGLNYLIFPGFWSYNRWNVTGNSGVQYTYQYPRAQGSWTLKLRGGLPGTSADYQQVSIENVHKHRIWRLELRSRFFVMYGTGRRLPIESALYLAGASPEDMMDNPWVRSYGFFPEVMTTFGAYLNNFHYGGGLNLRGYSGYLAPFNHGGGQYLTFASNSGAACNLELDLDELVVWKPRFSRNWLHWDIYLFADGGIINAYREGHHIRPAGIRMDAGAGLAMTIKKWGPWTQSMKPLTLRFDVPFFLNTPPANDPKYLDFRWLMGIQRAF